METKCDTTDDDDDTYIDNDDDDDVDDAVGDMVPMCLLCFTGDTKERNQFVFYELGRRQLFSEGNYLVVLVSGEQATVFECFQRAKINILSREVLFI